MTSPGDPERKKGTPLRPRLVFSRRQAHSAKSIGHRGKRKEGKRIRTSEDKKMRRSEDQEVRREEGKVVK